ncbi:MAG: universal stress protein [Acidobacteria bacterium]|nr:universal stress protein [Acidobacteriota bacterium]NIM63045.1 universal stress protein [Acidobacteriota bacterium]NIO58388.1 universal stress protein [Acidobacteriota bacterium]NIQ84062.1 universal stress protein [Acidobacteriota bacterium]NIT10154.1 universal stress protein [Acidobacteriota bacterium]
MRAILVGAGALGCELLKRIGERWVVTVVDRDPVCLEAARAVRSVPVVEGDGSSRIVLKRAGLERAAAMIAATNDDDTNVEVIRLAVESGVHRIISRVNDPSRAPEMRSRGAHVVSPMSLAARQLELSLENRRVSSVAFADGRAEAMEFRITEDSPVRGRLLKTFGSCPWTVGAILRRHELIIPHGETAFEAGDYVTVMGPSADFAEMVRTFTSGEGRFPLDFGKRVVLSVEGESDLDMTFGEAVHLVRGSRASSLLLVHPDTATIRDESKAAGVRQTLQLAPELAEGVAVRTRPVGGKPVHALGELHGEESVGVIVVKGNRKGLSGMWRAHRAPALVSWSGRPVLVSRGSAPYRRIVVPARRTASGRAAIRAAIDLARFNKADLIGVSVVDPIFLAGPDAEQNAERAMAWLEEEAAVHGVRVDPMIERGNPVRLLRKIANSADLMVLGIGSRLRSLALRRGVGSMVARGTSKSVLLVPA